MAMFFLSPDKYEGGVVRSFFELFSNDFLHRTYPSKDEGSAVAARQNDAAEASTVVESMPMRLVAVIMF